MDLSKRYGSSVAILVVVSLALTEVSHAGLLGVDVSRFQGDVNWNAMSQDGVSFGFAKATEGVGFLDSRFHSNMTNSRLAGVPIGAYHYARPDSFVGTLADPVKQDAINEANDFVDEIESYYLTYPGEYLRPVLDVEELPVSAEINTTSEQRAYLSDWVRDFNSVVQSRLGVDVIIYANANYTNNYLDASLRSFDLWLARWTYNTNNMPTNANLGVWNSWAFWQWSDSWNVGGITPIDGNYFDGDLNDLSQFLAGTTPLEGDYNGDGVVNAADYTVWRDSWLSLGENLPADGDNDGFVGNSDYDVWAINYGADESTAAAAAAIPEPSTLILMACGLIATSSKRKF